MQERSEKLGRFRSVKLAASRADLSQVFRLVYVSRATALFGPEELQRIGEESIARNEKLDVTGILVVDQGRILQVLEGDEDVVVTLFAKISNDLRHEAVQKVVASVQKKRYLSSWIMASGNEERVPAALREDYLRMYKRFTQNGSFADILSEEVELLKVMALFRAVPVS